MEIITIIFLLFSGASLTMQANPPKLELLLCEKDSKVFVYHLPTQKAIELNNALISKGFTCNFKKESKNDDE